MGKMDGGTRVEELIEKLWAKDTVNMDILVVVGNETPTEPEEEVETDLSIVVEAPRGPFENDDDEA